MKEFAARAFEEFQVAGIVNMIADGALGVGDAALTGEDWLVQRWRLGWEEGFANVVLEDVTVLSKECHRVFSFAGVAERPKKFIIKLWAGVG